MQTILVVDDEPQVRHFVVRCLVDAGYHVLEAASAHEAQKLATSAESGIQLLIVELRLNRQDGIEVANAVAARDLEIRVILTSGHPEDENFLKKLGGRYGSVLRKPFTPNTLLDQVDRALRGPPWVH